jgi:hypothetical protein
LLEVYRQSQVAGDERTGLAPPHAMCPLEHEHVLGSITLHAFWAKICTIQAMNNRRQLKQQVDGSAKSGVGSIQHATCKSIKEVFDLRFLALKGRS